MAFRHGNGNSATVAPSDSFPLDTPLLQFSPVDFWTIGDACEGVKIFGATGSGKTSGSGAALARSYLANGFGGLVMCAKPEERRLWQGYAEETNRTDDLIIIAPDQPYCFNFLDYELRRRDEGGGITENLINLLSSVIEIAEGKQDMGGGDHYWERAMRELLRNALEILRFSHQTVTVENIYRLILSAPQSPLQIDDDQWLKASFFAQCMNEAADRDKTEDELHDFSTAALYWFENYATLNERTRTSVVSTFTSVADILLHGIAWRLFCKETTIVPEVTYRHGIILVLDLPVQNYQEMGRIVQGIFKLMFQQAILRRDPQKYPRPVFLWADEAQNFVSHFDHSFQSVARSARASTVYLSQNISNYYAVLGAKGKDKTDSLLGNLRTQIFHANGSAPTNLYAAESINRGIAFTQGINRSPDGEVTISLSERPETYKAPPSVFTTLRTGGPRNDFCVDAILFRSGTPWNDTEDTYLPTTFKQQ